MRTVTVYNGSAMPWKPFLVLILGVPLVVAGLLALGRALGLRK